MINYRKRECIESAIEQTFRDFDLAKRQARAASDAVSNMVLKNETFDTNAFAEYREQNDEAQIMMRHCREELDALKVKYVKLIESIHFYEE